MQDIQNTIAEHRVLTISELTSEVKGLLEKTYPFIWITGEISNFKMPSSGHYYFTLKDPGAQISAVMFKGQARSLKFIPEDGMSITGFGRLSVYPPRGSYQLILEYLEASGAGALQAAFEQLKKKLSGEGLFDAIHKRPIPFLPSFITIISSPTGAVVHDIIRIIHRRFPGIQIGLIPVQVQGDAAVSDIVSALRFANETKEADLIILARGGGSIEDLAAFNSEAVAREIFASEIPVISAVGHETDYTIADFTADLRAPTPSAAAELAVPVRSDLEFTLQSYQRRLLARIRRLVEDGHKEATKLSRRLVHPRRRLDDMMLRLDDQTTRMQNALRNVFSAKKQQMAWQHGRLMANAPSRQTAVLREDLSRHEAHMKKAINALVQNRHARSDALSCRIAALNPRAVLDRGYSIVRSIPGQHIITNTDQVETGKNVEVIVSKGTMTCRVEKKE